MTFQKQSSKQTNDNQLTAAIVVVYGLSKFPDATLRNTIARAKALINLYQNKGEEMADTKQDFSLVIPTQGLGNDILEASMQQLQKRMQEEVVGQVQKMILRRNHLNSTVETVNNQIAHIDKQIDAIKNNQFTLNRGVVKFNDDSLNVDPAIAHPWK